MYEKIVDKKNIYGTRPIPIPRPEFFVLYNGVAPYPDEGILKLSDLFESGESLGLPERSPVLELEARVININHGRNAKIIKRCKTLEWYSAFVAKVREYEREGIGLEESIRKAIRYCIEHNILKDFLERNATEVENMLFTEWNMDDALAVRYEEGREEGRENRQEEIARKLQEMGISAEQIREATGLDMSARH